MKKLPAFFAAFLITAVIGAAMLAVGLNAVLNPNSVALADAPAGTQVSQVSTQDNSQAQVAQLQALVAQYQQREQQYQDRLSEAAQQLETQNAEVQGYQQILIELQRRGVIQVTQDGTLLIPSGRAHHDDGDFEFGD